MKRQGLYMVSYEKLGEFLGLDADHVVIGVDSSFNGYRCSTIFVKVAGPLMYEVIENGLTPVVQLDHLDIEKGRDEA